MKTAGKLGTWLKTSEHIDEKDKLLKKSTSRIYKGLENRNHSSDQRKMLTSDR